MGLSLSAPPITRYCELCSKLADPIRLYSEATAQIMP